MASCQQKLASCQKYLDPTPLPIWTHTMDKNGWKNTVFPLAWLWPWIHKKISILHQYPPLCPKKNMTVSPNFAQWEAVKTWMETQEIYVDVNTTWTVGYNLTQVVWFSGILYYNNLKFDSILITEMGKWRTKMLTVRGIKFQVDRTGHTLKRVADPNSGTIHVYTFTWHTFTI